MRKMEGNSLNELGGLNVLAALALLSRNAVIPGFFAESGLELRDTELFLRYTVVFEKRSSIQLQNFLITRMYGLELCDSFVKDRNITWKGRVAL